MRFDRYSLSYLPYRINTRIYDMGHVVTTVVFLFCTRRRLIAQAYSVGILGGADGAAVLRANRAPDPLCGNVPWSQARLAVRAVVEVRFCLHFSSCFFYYFLLPRHVSLANTVSFLVLVGVDVKAPCNETVVSPPSVVCG